MPGNLCLLLENYSNLVLAIMDDEDSDPLWHRFYRIQMANYLLGQENLKFELETVCLAYNLILNSWEELKDYMNHSKLPVRNFDNIFKRVNIDFPVDRYTMCQFDPEIKRNKFTVSF